MRVMSPNREIDREQKDKFWAREAIHCQIAAKVNN